MTSSRDPDRLIHAFLLEGAEQLQDRVYDAVRAEIEQKQQRAVLGPWRMPVMNRILPIGLAAAVVLAVLLVGSRLVGSPAGTVGGPGDGPSPTPEASVAAPSASPIAADGSLPKGPFEFEDNEMAMTVTIPASGWTFDPAYTVLEKGTEVANLPEAAILFWHWPAGTSFYVPGDPCRSESTRPDTPATTADEIVAALEAQASRNASEPADVTVGGYTGKSIILHVPGDAVPGECEQAEFVSYGTEAEPLTRYHQGPGQIDEFWFIDVDGAVVMIDAMYRPDTPAEFVEEMRAIAESATFE